MNDALTSMARMRLANTTINGHVQVMCLARIRLSISGFGLGSADLFAVGFFRGCQLTNGVAR